MDPNQTTKFRPILLDHVANEGKSNFKSEKIHLLINLSRTFTRINDTIIKKSKILDLHHFSTCLMILGLLLH